MRKVGRIHKDAEISLVYGITGDFGHGKPPPLSFLMRRLLIDASSLLLLGLRLVDSGNGLVDSLGGLPPDLSGQHQA